MLVTLSSRGQLVIPKAVRQALGLRAGARLHVRLAEGKIVLEPAGPGPIAALYGKYADADFLGQLETEHHQEMKRGGALRPCPQESLPCCGGGCAIKDVGG
jgi:AbrB family looped-hinge helix DNA binding protein